MQCTTLTIRRTLDPLEDQHTQNRINMDTTDNSSTVSSTIQQQYNSRTTTVVVASCSCYVLLCGCSRFTCSKLLCIDRSKSLRSNRPYDNVTTLRHEVNRHKIDLCVCRVCTKNTRHPHRISLSLPSLCPRSQGVHSSTTVLVRSTEN